MSIISGQGSEHATRKRSTSQFSRALSENRRLSSSGTSSKKKSSDSNSVYPPLCKKVFNNLLF